MGLPIVSIVSIACLLNSICFCYKIDYRQEFKTEQHPDPTITGVLVPGAADKIITDRQRPPNSNGVALLSEQLRKIDGDREKKIIEILDNEGAGSDKLAAVMYDGGDVGSAKSLESYKAEQKILISGLLSTETLRTGDIIKELMTTTESVANPVVVDKVISPEKSRDLIKSSMMNGLRSPKINYQRPEIDFQNEIMKKSKPLIRPQGSLATTGAMRNAPIPNASRKDVISQNAVENFEILKDKLYPKYYLEGLKLLLDRILEPDNVHGDSDKADDDSRIRDDVKDDNNGRRILKADHGGDRKASDKDNKDSGKTTGDEFEDFVELEENSEKPPKKIDDWNINVDKLKRSNISDNLIIAKISWQHLNLTMKHDGQSKRTSKNLRLEESHSISSSSVQVITEENVLEQDQPTTEEPDSIPRTDFPDYQNDNPLTTLRNEFAGKAKYLITYETLGGLFKGHVYTDCYSTSENDSATFVQENLEKMEDENCNIDLNLWPDTVYDVLVKDLQQNTVTSKLRIDTRMMDKEEELHRKESDVRSNQNPFLDDDQDKYDESGHQNVGYSNRDFETSKITHKLEILEKLLESDQSLDIEILRDAKPSNPNNNLIITIDEYREDGVFDRPQDLVVISEFLNQESKRSAPETSRHSGPGRATTSRKLEILKSYFMLSLLLLLIVIAVVFVVYFCVARERTKSRRKSFLLTTEEV